MRKVVLLVCILILLFLVDCQNTSVVNKLILINDEMSYLGVFVYGMNTIIIYGLLCLIFKIMHVNIEDEYY